MLFHVMCFSVYKIFINSDMTFLRKYDMCMLCDNAIIYINVHMYLLVTAIFDTNMYSSTVICSIFLSFNNELLSTTVWNTPILCHI